MIYGCFVIVWEPFQSFSLIDYSYNNSIFLASRRSVLYRMGEIHVYKNVWWSISKDI